MTTHMNMWQQCNNIYMESIMNRHWPPSISPCYCFIKEESVFAIKITMENVIQLCFTFYLSYCLCEDMYHFCYFNYVFWLVDVDAGSTLLKVLADDKDSNANIQYTIVRTSYSYKNSQGQPTSPQFNYVVSNKCYNRT